MAIDRRQFLDQGIKSGLAAAIGAAGPRAVAKPVAPNDKVVVGVMGVGGRGTQLTGFFADRPDVEIAYICDVNAKQLPGAVKVVAGQERQNAQDGRRFPPHFGGQIRGRHGVRHSRPLACLSHRDGLPGGQRHLRGKARLAQHLGRAEDGRGRAQVQSRGASRHAEPQQLVLCVGARD